MIILLITTAEEVTTAVGAACREKMHDNLSFFVIVLPEVEVW